MFVPICVFCVRENTYQDESTIRFVAWILGEYDYSGSLEWSIAKVWWTIVLRHRRMYCSYET